MLIMPNESIGIEDHGGPVRTAVLGPGCRIGKQAVVNSELVEIAGFGLGYIAGKIVIALRIQDSPHRAVVDLGITTHPNRNV